MGGDSAAVAHHRDPIGNASNLLHPVADVDNTDALGLQPANVVEQLRNLRVGQRGGRLVQDQEPAVLRKRTGDFDQLLLTDTEVGRRQVRIDAAKPYSRQRLACRVAQGRSADEPAMPRPVD